MKQWVGNIIGIGIFVGFFSALIPFSSLLTDLFGNEVGDKLEDIIYFRGILLGFLLISMGGVAILKDTMQNIVISLGVGIISILYMSTYNLIYGGLSEDINYYMPNRYFMITFIIAFVSFVIILILRLCWSKLSAFIAYLSSLRLFSQLLEGLSVLLGKLKKSEKNSLLKKE